MTASFILQAFRQTSNIYDDLEYIVRERLFAYLVADEQYSAAAKVLGASNVDSPSHPISDRDKADMYIKCAGKSFSTPTI